MVVEDIEHDLEHVHCSGSHIELRFKEAQGCKAAVKVLGELTEFTIITSHESCNLDGERRPHL